MDAQEIALKYRVPIAKIKRMVKDGIIKAKASDPRAAKIKATLRRGNHLTALACLWLVREPRLFGALGPVYEIKAREQVAALGDIASGSFGERAANLIFAAVTQNAMVQDEVDELAAMIREAVPPGGCSYHYLAARMLWGIVPERLEQSNYYLRLAFANMKYRKDLREWMRVEGRQTIFLNPMEALDL